MLKQILVVWLSMSVGALVMGLVGWTQLAAEPVLTLPQDIIGCPDDMARVGPVCVDKYEASVFRNAAGTGFQVGVDEDNYGAITVNCSDNGQNCNGIFAHSKAGVLPSTWITWFQAQQACLNVGKRLLTNAEWQGAAAFTPDPGTDNGSTDCNISNANAIVNTGSRSSCVSRWGTFDMVGNVWEWVADWMQDNQDIDDVSDTSTALYGTDKVIGIDEATPLTFGFPAALVRGGDFNDGASAGVFAVNGFDGPALPSAFFGFRCAR